MTAFLKYEKVIAIASCVMSVGLFLAWVVLGPLIHEHFNVSPPSLELLFKLSLGGGLSFFVLFSLVNVAALLISRVFRRNH